MTVCKRIAATPDLGLETVGVLFDEPHPAARGLERVPATIRV